MGIYCLILNRVLLRRFILKGVIGMMEIYGKGVSDGIAVGRIYYYSSEKNNIPKYSVSDTAAELKRYKNALRSAKKNLGELYDEACRRVSKNESVIFQTHIMILEDSKFVGSVEELILNRGLNAEFAVYDTAQKIAEIFRSIDDEYLKQRYTDILDAANTVLEILHPRRSSLTADNEPVILAAPELLPSETISFKQENMLGFITNKGSKNSHTAILARTLGLPLITQIKGSLSRFDGQLAIIDGQTGRIVIGPDHNTLAHYRAKQKRYLEKQLRLKSQLGLPSVTKDGKNIGLTVSIDNIDNLSVLKESDAQGVGIFKTDYLFANRKTPPSEEEQLSVYKTVLKAFENKQVVFSLANLSSEKGVSYIDIPEEKNPAIGYKGIRVLLSNKSLFMTQLRALFRASAFGKLSIVLPMVNNADEIEYVKRSLEEVKLQLRSKGYDFSGDIRLGTLIETPAAAIISDEISRISDFLIIASNALTQYTLAMDRENQKLEYFYEPYHKAVMRLIKLICKNAHKSGKKVALCGELACDVHTTKNFLAMGIDEFIVVPSRLLDVKAAIRETDTTEAKALIDRL